MALRHKLVAQTVYCEKVRRVDLQLLSEPQHVVVHRPCAGAFRAKPRATEVNSFPPRIRFFPNRVSKILLTAGTNEEPPVRKTMSTSLGRTPEDASRESTHRAICPSSSEIHSSKDARSTVAARSTNPSENWNVARGAFDKSLLTLCTARWR